MRVLLLLGVGRWALSKKAGVLSIVLRLVLFSTPNLLSRVHRH